MSDSRLVGQIRDDVEVWAASIEKAQAKISKPDACVEAQSAFDRCARVGLPQNEEFEVDQRTYLAFLTTQVLEWNKADFKALERIVASLRPAFNALPYKLPAKVWLIQTTGREEAAAAYTKHKDTIVLPANMVASVHSVESGGDPLHSGYSDDFLAGVITHEFFHLLSKNNPSERTRWYQTVNYQELPNEIRLPEDLKWPDENSPLPMSALKITNPDAPLINVAIKLPPSKGAQEILMAPALMSCKPYTNGAFFDTLEWIFLEVEIANGRADLKTGKDGAPIIHNKNDLMAAYREKIGYYLTGELFHPDELLAQTFALAAKQFQPPLLEKIAGSIWPSRPE